MKRPIFCLLVAACAVAIFSSAASADVRATECRYFDGSENNAPALTKTILEQAYASAVLFCFDTREGEPKAAVALPKPSAFGVCVTTERPIGNSSGRWSMKITAQGPGLDLVPRSQT